MKITCKIFLFLFLLTAGSSFAQHKHIKKDEPKSNAVLIPGLEGHHHKVSTKNKLAQKFFDQGMILIYGFNHNEAIKSFQKAAELDPELAMAYWGIAYALGPNYNLPADNEQRKLAYNAMKKAIKLSDGATKQEQDYIKALSKRYVKDVDKVQQQKLDVEFKNAMKDLHLKYPEDLDAATLYAESLMNLKPWQLWNKDGTPAEGTEEIVSVLESVIKKDPKHPGANHYYIHAVEASNDPGRALASAETLKNLVPAAGHLVHMPAHIFFRVGDYEGASLANLNAINSDETYIKNYDPQGVYPVMYYTHNLNFLSVSRMMEGNFAEAIKYANQTAKNVEPVMSQMQMVEGYYANPLMIMLSFGKWNDLINTPDADTAFKVYSALVNFSKGIANASLGNIIEAKRNLTGLKNSSSTVGPESVVGLNPASFILNLAEITLEGKIASAEGNTEKAVELLKLAAQKEDSVNYNEPPDWYPSVRLMLGSVLFKNGKYMEAENVFREELKKYPHNGRGLFGLMKSLEAQGKTEDAKTVSDEFSNAWKNADVELSMESL